MGSVNAKQLRKTYLAHVDLQEAEMREPRGDVVQRHTWRLVVDGANRHVYASEAQADDPMSQLLSYQNELGTRA